MKGINCDDMECSKYFPIKGANGKKRKYNKHGIDGIGYTKNFLSYQLVLNEIIKTKKN